MIALATSETDGALPPSAIDIPDTLDGDDDPRLDGLRRLWTRVLVNSMCEYWLAPPTSVRFREALEWLFHSDPDARNSFENVCDLLQLDPLRTRAMVARRCSEFRDNPARAEPIILAMQANGFSLPK